MWYSQCWDIASTVGKCMGGKVNRSSIFLFNPQEKSESFEVFGCLFVFYFKFAEVCLNAVSFTCW